MCSVDNRSTATLVLAEALAGQLAEIARAPVESAGVLLVSVLAQEDEAVRLLGREYHPVPTTAYIRREHDELVIASEGYVNALGRAEELGATPLWFHTHPGEGSSPFPSEHDELVDQQLCDVFRLRSGSKFYGSVIMSPRPNGVAFTGLVDGEAGCQRASIERLWIVGDRFKLTHAEGRGVQEPLDMFDRHVRAFGPAIQTTLSDLKVGIVGCGGTGSAVAEQLVRLGVRRFMLIDPDVLSYSNVTRVYGSTPSDVGREKVEIVARNLRAIAPGAVCECVKSTITMSRAAQRLLFCDVVFGCTDDNAGRLVISRIPTYLLIPVIDCGVRLSSNGSGELTGIDGRVTVLAPGQACLLCRGRIDVARASAELLTPDERRRLEDEGYAPALGQIEPAVVTFTTMVAAAAVSELLERLIGYGPTPRPTELLLRFHEREISTNMATPRQNHYCDVSAGKLARGITQPFLDLAWSA